MIPEWIRWWMAHRPELVWAWAVLATVDLILFVLAFFFSDEERGFESASAVGVVDDLRMENM